MGKMLYNHLDLREKTTSLRLLEKLNKGERSNEERAVQQTMQYDDSRLWGGGARALFKPNK